VVIALGYGLDDWSSTVRFPVGLGIFLFTTVSRTALGLTQPPIQWVPGALSLGVKRLGLEADHSPPSSVEVKNAWSYTSTPQYVFMAWCLVKHRDNFTFYLVVQYISCVNILKCPVVVYILGKLTYMFMSWFPGL
jgi:hypothetical protein